MSAATPNVAASVRARLLNVAKARGETVAWMEQRSIQATAYILDVVNTLP